MANLQFIHLIITDITKSVIMSQIQVIIKFVIMNSSFISKYSRFKSHIQILIGENVKHFSLRNHQLVQN